ncbi:MAG TPA: DUF4287 domain-containing protein [Miltoncostaeaceae bacterium]|nr:DUF4287 domain-containing protein [Miltoncostaeaceae bacterium]
MEIVNWLKSEPGMGHGHANALVHHARDEDAAAGCGERREEPVDVADAQSDRLAGDELDRVAGLPGRHRRALLVFWCAWDCRMR